MKETSPILVIESWDAYDYEVRFNGEWAFDLCKEELVKFFPHISEAAGLLVLRDDDDTAVNPVRFRVTVETGEGPFVLYRSPAIYPNTSLTVYHGSDPYMQYYLKSIYPRTSKVAFPRLFELAYDDLSVVWEQTANITLDLVE